MKSVIRISGVTGRVTLSLAMVVAISISVMAGLGYFKLSQVTETNSAIRIDRAARAAASILDHALAGEFSLIRDTTGKPAALRIEGGTLEESLSFRPQYDELLKEIGLNNQGAANLFKLNVETKGFDRFATTFRKPDGTMPPPMSITEGHPAWESIFNNRVHVGEVPVMGRMRLATLTPIQAQDGSVAGALAVDVGWADDLTVARDELRSIIFVTSVLILLVVIAFGASRMTKELRPLRRLAAYANEVALGKNSAKVPYIEKNDEIGALAQGLCRVVELQNKLTHLAYADELTGLGNRTRYLEDLEDSVRDSIAGNGKWALAHIDVDKFKDTNDAYGQAAGDDLLRLVGVAIREAVGDNAKISRLAGDNFTLLMPYEHKATELLRSLERLKVRLSEPFLLKQGEVLGSASIGVVVMPKNAKSADEAHRNAGIALSKAKDNERGQFVFFAEEMNEAVQNKIAMERMLREAIDNCDIALHYQPQINPINNNLEGIEALARWPHAERGMIPPFEFIPVAESSGLIVELGKLTLDQACQQAREWLDQGFNFKHISVNVSPIQLWQPDFIKVVKRSLDKHGILGKHICMEVTEGVFVDHSGEKIGNVLDQLRALGMSLSLDDFGSGYSSLGYLNRLPFDQLKVDRSFVTRLDKDVRKQNVLQGIVALGKGLGLTIVVEGAETEEEIMMIKLIGCNSVQGYFYARPMPSIEVIPAVTKLSNTKPVQTKAKAG